MTNQQKAGGVLPEDTEAVYVDYKEPLTKVKGGYGYLGVLCTNKTETHLQCHECGLFFRHLGAHVQRGHGIKADQYREKYQLRKTTGLVPRATHEAMKRRVENADSLTKLKRITGLRKGAAKLEQMKREGYRKRQPYSLENKNKNGTCPAQLLDKIKLLAKDLGYTPSQLEFGKAYKTGHIEAVYRTYGSWTNAVRIAGLKPKGQGRQPLYSQEILINIMRDYYDRYGRQPSYNDFVKTRGVPSHTNLYKYFGSYSKAIQAAFNNYETSKS